MKRVLYRVMVMAVVVPLMSVGAEAFFPTIHVDITKDALSKISNIWTPPSSVQQLLKGHWFSEEAIREISDANIAKDTGNCGADDAPAKPCRFTNTGAETNFLERIMPPDTLDQLAAALAIVELTNPEDHFDNELIELANNLLLGIRKPIVEDLKARRFVAARKKLGGALHAIQDFYSHTNWVEMGNTAIEPRLGESSFRSGAPALAEKTDPTCVEGTDGSFLIPVRKLTSSYFTKDGAPIPRGKCAHGATVTLGTRGINKDYTVWEGVALVGLKSAEANRFTVTIRPETIEAEIAAARERYNREKLLFSTARRLAYLHTMKFVVTFLDDKAVQADPLIILGLMGHPIISTLAPDYINPGADGVSLVVSGSGFRESSVVSWNGSPRDTQFIDGGRLVASITKSDVARPTTAEVKVLNGAVDSSPHPFKVSGDICDCPGPVTRHFHRNGLLDVNAQKWNDTGLNVEKGQTVLIDVGANGLILWRPGVLTGNLSPPHGDPGVTPKNTLLWVTPPYASAPVGALIGAVFESGAAGPPAADRMFPVFTGGRPFQMPARGRLFLGINDGILFNNSGCFQARIIPR